jgi:hypothetical protein
MRYVFAKSNLKVSITLEAGGLTLYFPPEEQWLAYAVVRGIMNLLEDGTELSEIAELLRTEHNKQEEN